MRIEGIMKWHCLYNMGPTSTIQFLQKRFAIGFSRNLILWGVLRMAYLGRLLELFCSDMAGHETQSFLDLLQELSVLVSRFCMVH